MKQYVFVVLESVLSLIFSHSAAKVSHTKLVIKLYVFVVLGSVFALIFPHSQGVWGCVSAPIYIYI